MDDKRGLKVYGLAGAVSVFLAGTCAYAGDGIVFPGDFDHSKGYAMCAAKDGGGWNAPRASAGIVTVVLCCR